MRTQTNLLVRALELAGTRRLASATEIRTQLRAEGFSEIAVDSTLDVFATRRVIGQILKAGIRPPPFSWISK